MHAGCRMADMITPEQLRKYRLEHPDTKVITYVNSTASVKALSDCICTSTNALKIINHYVQNGEKILYCPDQNLGKYAMKQGGVSFDVWNGCCPIHHFIDKNKLLKLKEENPNALLITHPECQLEIIEISDYVGSTKQLLDFAVNSDAKEFIVCTEKGIIHALEKQCPDKKFILASPTLTCAHMKYTKLEDVYNCLVNESNEVFVDEEVVSKAKLALDKMLELSK